MFFASEGDASRGQCMGTWRQAIVPGEPKKCSPDSVPRGQNSGGFVGGEDFDGIKDMLVMDVLGVEFD